MIALLCGLSIAAAGETSWEPGLARVEILSDDPGTWIHYELPLAHLRPSTAALRLVEQIQPVWRAPWTGITIGTSVAIQTVQLERAVGSREDLSWKKWAKARLIVERGRN